MKQTISIFLICLMSAFAFSMKAQSTRTYYCDLFEFTYPLSYKVTPITNAPHMVLKLEDEKHLFSASYWDYNLDDDFNIWDDECVKNYQHSNDPNSTVVSVTKDYISTKKGYVKCLRILANATKNINGTVYHWKTITFIFTKREYLFVFSMMSEGSYNEQSDLRYPKSLMSGLYLY